MNPRAPQFLGIEPQFSVVDLVRTATYYRDVLGFQLGNFFGDPPVFVQATRHRVTIQFGRANDPAQATRACGGAGCNAYVWVDDVDALAEEYARRGAHIVEGPVDRAYSCRELVVEDCNGLVLCFAQDTSGGKPR